MAGSIRPRHRAGPGAATRRQGAAGQARHRCAARHRVTAAAAGRDRGGGQAAGDGRGVPAARHGWRARARWCCPSPPAAPSPASRSICPRARRWSARCPTRRPPFSAASPSAFPMRTSRRSQRATCDALLRAVGEVAWVDDEGLIDAVTAVSGSGPAYVFYLAECLAEAGIKAGLAPELARQLARATVAGLGRAAAPLRPRRRCAAPERHLARRHHLRRPAGADGGERRAARADAQSRRRRHPPLPRAGEVATSSPRRSV